MEFASNLKGINTLEVDGIEHMPDDKDVEQLIKDLKRTGWL